MIKLYVIARRHTRKLRPLLSVLFLISYLIYHFNVGSVRFTGQGWIRSVYFTILISHTILASAVPFLAVITLYRAWKGEFHRHRRIARTPSENDA